MSSRNQYLEPEQRNLAALLYATLQRVRSDVLAGASATEAEAQALAALNAAGFRPDYVSVRDAADLQKSPLDRSAKRIVLAAAWLGKTRLIDNLLI
jgi:pantoate--beta-alanine ligase